MESHIHEAGDLSEKCMGACAHFNPYNKKHGGPTSKERHVGDLGNIRFDARGVAKFRMEDSLVKLRGTKANVIGRSVVIHEDMDDLGMGNHNDSLTTGHAGKRITCAVIGYSKRNFFTINRMNVIFLYTNRQPLVFHRVYHTLNLLKT